ncbi:MAG: PRC-barrel domain-containing protein, partial [Brasilonema sp.]
RNNVLKGTRILTVNGRDLGTMVDLYFDEHTGSVEGYEVSGGLFADAYSGRSFVPAPQTLKIGEDVAFVPMETAELMQEQVGGIKGAVQSAGDTLQVTTTVAGQKLQEAAQTATERLQETTEAVRKQLQDANQATVASITNTIVDPAAQKAFVIGKVADQDVVASDGTLLVTQGQLVTFLVAEEAERLGVLDQLYRATGGRVVTELNRKIQETANTTSVQFQEFVDTTGEKLHQTAGVANEILREMTRSAAARLTNAVVNPEDQKALIIDRVVDRDVIAPDGTLLIAEDQLVTLEIADEAERQGVLDQLFRAAGGSLSTELSNLADSFLAGRVIEQALGRRVNRIVQTNEALVVAAPGQIVTPQVIGRAQAYGQEQALLNAVGLTSVDAAYSNANRTFADTSELVLDGVIQMRQNANTLLVVLRERFEYLRKQAVKVLEEQRIKQALGRPVNRIILDRKDNIILSPGDIITHRAIELARQAGVLDILFSSVWKTPELPATVLLNPSTKTEVKDLKSVVLSS